MIVYKGIDLDINDKVLQSFIVSGGLTKVESLQARTGLKSVEFSIPITAKNQLAFENINTEGAQSEAFGECYLKIDNNIFQKGILYVRGYDNENFKVLFVGSFNNAMDNLSKKKLKEVFPKDYQFTYNVANAIIALENGISQSLNTGVSFHLGHPNLNELNAANQVQFSKLGFFFSFRHLINKILFDDGITLTSEFIDSDYGQALDYSDFNGEHLSSNTWENSGELIKATALINAQPLNLGTALANNNSVVLDVSVPTLPYYELQNACTKIRLNGVFNFTKGNDIEDVQLAFQVYNSASTLIYTSFGWKVLNGYLQEGRNVLDIEIDGTFPANSQIFFTQVVTLKSGASYPTDGSLTCDYIMISHDNIQLNDAIYLGNEVGDMTQLEFLKGFLVDNNLVLDIEGDKAVIELQDEGYTPVQTEQLPSIRNIERDISVLVDKEIEVTLDYLQAGTINLNQKILSNNFVDESQMFPFQKVGSYLYELNSFQKREVENYESFFNVVYDHADFTLTPQVGTLPIDTWEKYMSLRYGSSTEDYNETIAINFQTAPTPTAVDALVNWSRYVMFVSKWKGFFKATLDQKKNNKILQIDFKDQNGTIINNRTTYIINNQKYKMIDWSFDLITKQAKANLTLL